MPFDACNEWLRASDWSLIASGSAFLSATATSLLENCTSEWLVIDVNLFNYYDVDPFQIKSTLLSCATSTTPKSLVKFEQIEKAHSVLAQIVTGILTEWRERSVLQVVLLLLLLLKMLPAKNFHLFTCCQRNWKGDGGSRRTFSLRGLHETVVCRKAGWRSEWRGVRQRRSRFSGGCLWWWCCWCERWWNVASCCEDVRPSSKGGSAATKSSGACSRSIYSKAAAAVVWRCQVHTGLFIRDTSGWCSFHQDIHSGGRAQAEARTLLH